jgi:hypothetical protein
MLNLLQHLIRYVARVSFTCIVGCRNKFGMTAGGVFGENNLISPKPRRLFRRQAFRRFSC